MRHPSARAFTLAELLLSIGLLTLLILLLTRMFNAAAAVTILGNKRMDTDSQARPLFERMATDFAQMVRRSDVDYYFKSPAAPQTGGNDQIAFYSNVPGYYPSTGSPSPLSLVAYRVNSIAGSSSLNKLERMAKGLLWNGSATSTTPMVFLPATITANWPAATDSSADSAGDYEPIAPYVFRFEYYYVLTSGALSAVPWDAAAGHTAINGTQDLAGMSVCIAVIDPKSRLLVSDSQLANLSSQLTDFSSSMKPGDLVAQWQTALDATSAIARSSVSAVRLYEHYFALAPKR